MNPINEKAQTPTILKILVLGEANSGKTAIVRRYCQNFFLEKNQTSIGLDLSVKNVNFNGKQYKLNIWDTTGQERFVSLTSTHYRGCSGVLLTCDMSDINCLEKVSFWEKEIKEHSPSVPIIFVGTKCDITNALSEDIIDQIARKHGFSWLITSAKNNINIEAAFLLLLERVVEHQKELKLDELQKEEFDLNGSRLQHPLPYFPQKTKKCC